MCVFLNKVIIFRYFFLSNDILLGLMVIILCDCLNLYIFLFYEILEVLECFFYFLLFKLIDIPLFQIFYLSLSLIVFL